MAKVGYVMNYAGYRANTDKEWMKRFGCNEIMEEQQDYELRTEWNKLLDRLNKGDELVVPKLSHVLRETRQLSYLLEYCRLKEIRLISIHDCIDSGNELFPETQMSDILNVVALLPKEAFDIRKSSDAVRKVKRMQNGFLWPRMFWRIDLYQIVAGTGLRKKPSVRRWGSWHVWTAGRNPKMPGLR